MIGLKKATILVRFDSSIYQLKKTLAEAEVHRTEAELAYVRNGFRETEIEEARNEYAALLAESEGARKILTRLERLTQSMAASQQEYRRAIHASDDAPESGGGCPESAIDH